MVRGKGFFDTKDHACTTEDKGWLLGLGLCLPHRWDIYEYGEYSSSIEIPKIVVKSFLRLLCL